jgi:hypothetical protein
MNLFLNPNQDQVKRQQAEAALQRVKGLGQGALGPQAAQG